MRTTLTMLAALVVLAAQVLIGPAPVRADGRRATVIPAPPGFMAPDVVEGEQAREHSTSGLPPSMARAEPIVTEANRSPRVASAPRRPPPYYPRRLYRRLLTVDPESAH